MLLRTLMILCGMSGSILLVIGLIISLPGRTENANVNNNITPKPTVGKGAEIWVDADKIWYPTGLTVSGRVFITYQHGEWTNGGNNPIWSDTTGSGYAKNTLMPTAPIRGLIGKVGDNIFYIGRQYQGRPGKGMLYLSMNDTPNSFHDNQGHIRISILVE